MVILLIEKNYYITGWNAGTFRDDWDNTPIDMLCKGRVHAP